MPHTFGEKYVAIRDRSYKERSDRGAIWQSAVSSIGRDQEIAPTKSGQRSWVFLSSIPFYFFIEKTTELRGFGPSRKSPFGCMLFNNFNIYCLKNV